MIQGGGRGIELGIREIAYLVPAIDELYKHMRLIQENVYHMSIEERKQRGIARLPSSLGEALDELEKDTLIRNVMGDDVFEKYLAAKRNEWLEYCTLVTDWEMERYLYI
jgi:glutamine synthetase